MIITWSGGGDLDAPPADPYDEPIGGATENGEAKGEVVKVRVNSEQCQGHNRCYALAAELFDVDDYGNAFARGDGAVPPELEDKAKLARDNCPEFAVELEK